MTEWNPPQGDARAAPGWYADPWRLAPLRWWNGNEWTGYLGQGAEPTAWVPRTKQGWAVFLIASVIGLAVWIPTVAMQPRTDYQHEYNDTVSNWFYVVPIVAAVVLGALFAADWQVVGPGLVFPQLLLAPFTAPRGDNDGLWVLIIPMLVVFGVVLYCIAGSASVARRGRRART